MIGDNIAVLLPPGQLKILPLGKSEICIGGILVTGVASDERTVLCLIWILAIVQSVGQALLDGFILIQMHGDNAGCCQCDSPPSKQNKSSCCFEAARA